MAFKSPLNYIGGKQKILPQLLPLFPEKIGTFVDLFAGGANVGINVHAEKVVLNDNLVYLIQMYQAFQNLPTEDIIKHIEERITKFELSMENEAGYKAMRQHYNTEKHPLDLFVLIAYSFNHQIRFNNHHGFNNPFGRNRSSFNRTMRQNLTHFVETLQTKNIALTAHSFEKFDFEALGEDDFVYCDPPYLITTGTYNDGKRGFKGWSEKEERELLQTLDALQARHIRFALSNVLEHKGKKNELLENWLAQNPDFQVHQIKNNYANSNYQTLDRNKNASLEVVITNYRKEKYLPTATLSLF
ncbi:MAG: Dam family site-specific DNA-(adenine-N6)-methyltransferase [Bacteroidetes bacterium]|nr:MAG: Dam family site-specific DNA-(adenine-N6)-methyltransferase [Bacteroidota bacterium]